MREGSVTERVRGTHVAEVTSGPPLILVLNPGLVVPLDSTMIVDQRPD